MKVQLNLCIVAVAETMNLKNGRKSVRTKTLRVGLIDCGNIYISISEDGRFFVNWYFDGLRAENSDQLWNEYYGEDYGRASWEDLKAGKGRTMRKKQIEKYL